MTMHEHSSTDVSFDANGAINDQGQVAGVACSGQAAIASSGGDLLELGTLGGGSRRAWALNDAGRAVGHSYVAGNSAARAFLCRGGVVQGLGTLGGSTSVAGGINDSGQVVGQSYTSGEQSGRVSVHEDGAVRDLGTPGGPSSIARGIDDAGRVVGHAQSSDRRCRAALWADDGSGHQPFAIDGLVNDRVVNSGWTFATAYGISDVGRFLLAHGQNARLRFNGWTVLEAPRSPTQTVTPESATVALPGAGARPWSRRSTPARDDLSHLDALPTMIPRLLRIPPLFHSLALLALAGCATTTARATPAGLAAAEQAARTAIAREDSLRTAALPARSLGVLPFALATADTSLAPLAYGLADLLLTDLARSAQLDVVDRLTVDVLLRELDLARTGRVDSLTAPRVGRLVGARRLVVGAITADTAARVRLTARVADVATGATTPGGASTTALDAILDAEKALAFQLFDAMDVALTPRERALVEQRPTRNLAALLAYSRGVRDEAFGRYDAASAEYRQALALDPRFTLARTRLQSVGGAAPATSVRRAALGVAAGVAPTTGPAAAAAADPSFAGAQDRSATLIIRVRPTP